MGQSRYFRDVRVRSTWAPTRDKSRTSLHFGFGPIGAKIVLQSNHSESDRLGVAIREGQGKEIFGDDLAACCRGRKG